MSKKLISIAVLAVMLVTVNGGKASAESLEVKPFAQKDSLVKILGMRELNQPLLAVESIVVPPKAEPEPIPEPPKPIEYVVVEGDNLTKIAEKHQITVEKLWSKNTHISHQDVLKVGDKITVPLSDEELSARAFVAPVAPVAPVIQSVPAYSTSTQAVKPATGGVRGSFSGGNTYDYGYCTWYVKNKRGASLPNGLGNANTWYSRAQSMGMAVGSSPAVGAVGTTTRGSLGHVVYVEAVHGDGTITISEMNYKGFGIQSSRVTSASEFVYIY